MSEVFLIRLLLLIEWLPASFILKCLPDSLAAGVLYIRGRIKRTEEGCNLRKCANIRVLLMEPDHILYILYTQTCLVLRLTLETCHEDIHSDFQHQHRADEAVALKNLLCLFSTFQYVLKMTYTSVNLASSG